MSHLDLNVFQRVHGRWSDATFGKRSNPIGPLNHLKKEVQEVIENV